MNLTTGLGEEFLTYLRVERRFSKRTIDEYAIDLRLFMEFIAQETGAIRIEEITLPLLRRYLLYLEEQRGNGPALRSRRVSSLRTFFNYLVSEGYIKTNPALKLSKPKLDKKLPVYLTVEECERLIQVMVENCTHSLRNATIVKLLLSTGIRISELLGLSIHDVSLTRREIKVMGKGSKERIVPLASGIWEQLSQYIQARPETSEEALFLTLNGGKYKRIAKTTIADIFRKYAKLAGIEGKHVTPHKLRHTFATILYQNKVDIIELQQLLGHSSIATTQIYTHTNKERLRSAVEKMPVKETRTKYKISRGNA